MRINKYITGTLVALCAAGPAMGHHEKTLSSAAVNLSLMEIGLVFLGLATVCFTVCKSYKNKV
ncbi:MAG: hypothetical protein P8L81_07890 [Hellea sp.]|nr:hypothetical protein [Hellea sp.]|tara:strand:- start:140 stop:328 length:189 start_codon:yes stop_codon:yes gene_type:complete